MKREGDNMRKADPDCFVNKLMKHVSESTADVVIVDDLRFKNEAMRLIVEGAVLVRIEHWNDKNLVDEHITETDLDSVPDKVWARKYIPKYGEITSLATSFAKEFIESYERVRAEGCWVDPVITDQKNYDEVKKELTNVKMTRETQFKFKINKNVKKGEFYSLFRPGALSELIYRVVQKKEDGTLILKPARKINFR